jgi:hypothetical protein
LSFHRTGPRALHLFFVHDDNDDDYDDDDDDDYDDDDGDDDDGFVSISHNRKKVANQKECAKEIQRRRRISYC